MNHYLNDNVAIQRKQNDRTYYKFDFIRSLYYWNTTNGILIMNKCCIYLGNHYCSDIALIKFCRLNITFKRKIFLRDIRHLLCRWIRHDDILLELTKEDATECKSVWYCCYVDFLHLFLLIICWYEWKHWNKCKSTSSETELGFFFSERNWSMTATIIEWFISQL